MLALRVLSGKYEDRLKINPLYITWSMCQCIGVRLVKFSNFVNYPDQRSFKVTSALKSRLLKRASLA